MRATMDVAWFILFVFMLLEASIVLLLVMPMPSNRVRGAIITGIVSTWESLPAVRYIAIGLTLINLIYFCFVVDALLEPWKYFYAQTFSADQEWMVSCEMRAVQFERERNAYITGFSLFLFLILRRLVDIQAKLYQTRSETKQHMAGVPMGTKVD